MLVNTITGEAWTKHLKDRAEAQKKLSEAAAKGAGPDEDIRGAAQGRGRHG